MNDSCFSTSTNVVHEKYSFRSARAPLTPASSPDAHRPPPEGERASVLRRKAAQIIPSSRFALRATGRASKRHGGGGASSETRNSSFLSGREGHRGGPLQKGEHRTGLSMRRKGGLSLCGTEAPMQHFRGPRASHFRVEVSSKCVTSCFKLSTEEVRIF